MTTMIEKMFDSLLDVTRDKLNQAFFDRSSRVCETIGRAGLLIGAAIALILALTVAIRTDSFSSFTGGLGWILAFIVLQYVSSKLIPACAKAVETDSVRLASAGLLRALALLLLIAAAAAALAGIIVSIRLRRIDDAIGGLGLAVMLVHAAVVALNPQIAKTELVDFTSRSQEAVAILSFVLKAVLRLVPVIFGAGIALAVIQGSWVTIQQMRESYVADIGKVLGPIFLFGVAPAAIYLASLLYSVILDIWSSILSLPGKLDALRK